MTREDQAASSSAELERKLAALPPAPGCYLFKDKAGAILYVGKAKSLRARVRSYFPRNNSQAGSDERIFIPILRRTVADLETVVAASEKEAAVLENELIKRHQPRFNVKLRDDKDFLCLRLDDRADWPRVTPVRRPSPDGARYFGPYHSATSARRTLHLVNKHFQLRTCSDSELGSRRRPCLQYQIKRCAAPCVYEVDRGWYAEQVRTVELFLDNRHDELTAELQRRMRQASDAFAYELAAMYRDQLRAVEQAQERQRVVSVQRIDQDVIGLYREGEMIELLVMQVRQGHVIETQSFALGPSELPDEEIVAGFVGQYYAAVEPAPALPDELLLPAEVEAAAGIAAFLGEKRGKLVRVLVPRQGPRRQLLALAAENAAHAFNEKRRATAEIEERLASLQQKLRLSTLPRHIECCDISHLGGGDAVGGVVAMADGQLDKRRYRTFKIRTTAQGDDYAAMYETLARRFRRGRDAAADGEPDWDLPDLFVVDGGRGQLGIALAAARDLGLHDLNIVALAKERPPAGPRSGPAKENAAPRSGPAKENAAPRSGPAEEDAAAAGEKMVDRVYLPGQKNGIPLSAQSALVLLARLRDEAHRFANKGREKRGEKRTLRSELDEIAGLGGSARRALLTGLGSMKAVRAASDEQILAVPGVTKRHLTALRKVIPAPSGS